MEINKKEIYVGVITDDKIIVTNDNLYCFELSLSFRKAKENPMISRLEIKIENYKYLSSYIVMVLMNNNVIDLDISNSNGESIIEIEDLEVTVNDIFRLKIYSENMLILSSIKYLVKVYYY